MRPDHRRLGSTAGPGAQGAAAISQTAILIHHRDPVRNVARFYAMPVRADLLAGWTLVVSGAGPEIRGTPDDDPTRQGRSPHKRCREPPVAGTHDSRCAG